MVKTVTKYIASDGKEFDTLAEAEAHDKKHQNILQKNYEKFLTTYSGRELLKTHGLDDYGLWMVRGEDPNCDFGGHHHEPKIGVAEGKLRDVILWAVVHPNFWQWGSGGRITKYDATTIKIGDGGIQQ